MQLTSLPRRLQEFRDLVEIARAYLVGDIHFSKVCSAAVAFQQAANIYAVDSRIRQLAMEWVNMSARVWPEWGKVENPVTPEEFREWVQCQLRVFDAADDQ